MQARSFGKEEEPTMTQGHCVIPFTEGWRFIKGDNPGAADLVVRHVAR